MDIVVYMLGFFFLRISSYIYKNMSLLYIGNHYTSLIQEACHLAVPVSNSIIDDALFFSMHVHTATAASDQKEQTEVLFYGE